MSESSASRNKHWTAIQWFSLLVSCGGVYLIVFSGATLYEILRTNGWPIVEGTVTELKVFERGTTADFLVLYSYSVDGELYQGQWGEGPNHGRGVPGADSEYTSLHLLIEDFRNKFGPGEAITVHYNPSRPSDSFIEPEENPVVGAAVIAVFGLIFSAALPCVSSHCR